MQTQEGGESAFVSYGRQTGKTISAFEMKGTTKINVQVVIFHETHSLIVFTLQELLKSEI